MVYYGYYEDDERGVTPDSEDELKAAIEKFKNRIKYIKETFIPRLKEQRKELIKQGLGTFANSFDEMRIEAMNKINMLETKIEKYAEYLTDIKEGKFELLPAAMRARAKKKALSKRKHMKPAIRYKYKKLIPKKR
jgi:pyruvate-formate lyase-activating enzyme